MHQLLRARERERACAESWWGGVRVQGLVRVWVGLDPTDHLIDVFAQALEAAKASVVEDGSSVAE